MQPSSVWTVTIFPNDKYSFYTQYKMNICCSYLVIWGEKNQSNEDKSLELMKAVSKIMYFRRDT